VWKPLGQGGSGVRKTDRYRTSSGCGQWLGPSWSNSRARWLYGLTGPACPFLQKRFGRWITSTDVLAAAMLQLATTPNARKTLNTRELNVLAGQPSAR
jgi:hypothetical protein